MFWIWGQDCEQGLGVCQGLMKETGLQAETSWDAAECLSTGSLGKSPSW